MVVEVVVVLDVSDLTNLLLVHSIATPSHRLIYLVISLYTCTSSVREFSHFYMLSIYFILLGIITLLRIAIAHTWNKHM